VPPETPTPARATVRVPLEAEVVVEFDRFSGFLAEYSSNLSLGGMFLTTRYLKPVGSELRFELRLKDAAAPLVRGRGMVAWTRWQDQGPRRPAGMGVRFLDLDAESHALIYKIVEERLRAGQIHEELALDPTTLAEVAAANAGDAADPRLAPAIPDAALEIVETPRVPPADGGAAAPAEPAPPRIDAPTTSAGAPIAPRPIPAAPPLHEIVARAAAAWAPEPAPPLPPPTMPKPPAARDRDPQPVARAQPPRPRKKPAAGAAWISIALVVAGAGGWWLWRSGLLSPGEPPSSAAPPAKTPPAPAAVARPEEPSPSPPDVASKAAPGPLTADDGTPAAPLPSREPQPGPAAAATLPRFTGLDKVTWSEESGFTEVVLWMDGAIPADAFERSRIDGKEPRELVRLRGASRPVEAARYDVGTPEVRRVRTGLHGSGASAELHVVLDLAAGARVFEAQVDGNRLLLRAAFR
jgi:molecular chaperone DnaK